MDASLWITCARILSQSKFVLFTVLFDYLRHTRRSLTSHLFILNSTEDEITHILHVCKELPLPSHPHEFADSNGDRKGTEPSQ